MPSANDTRISDAQKVLIEALRARLASSRVTLRLRREGRITLVAESLAPGVTSMRSGTQEDAASFPTYHILERNGEVLVQDDLLQHEVRPPQSLIDEYRTHAQMLARVAVEGDTVGVVSVHQVDAPRHWAPDEVEALDIAAKAIALLETPNHAQPT